MAEAQSTVTGTEHSAQLPGREAQADSQAHGRDHRAQADSQSHSEQGGGIDHSAQGRGRGIAKRGTANRHSEGSSVRGTEWLCSVILRANIFYSTILSSYHSVTLCYYYFIVLLFHACIKYSILLKVGAIHFTIRIICL